MATTCKVWYDTPLRFRSADERCTHEDHDFSRSSTLGRDVRRGRRLHARARSLYSRLYYYFTALRDTAVGARAAPFRVRAQAKLHRDTHF